MSFPVQVLTPLFTAEYEEEDEEQHGEDEFDCSDIWISGADEFDSGIGNDNFAANDSFDTKNCSFENEVDEKENEGGSCISSECRDRVTCVRHLSCVFAKSSAAYDNQRLRKFRLNDTLCVKRLENYGQTPSGNTGGLSEDLDTIPPLLLSRVWTERAVRASREKERDEGRRSAPLSALHNEILRFCANCTLSPSEIVSRLSLLNAVRDAARRLWKSRCMVSLFGSSATGLCVPKSDVDFCISLTKPAMEEGIAGEGDVWMEDEGVRGGQGEGGREDEGETRESDHSRGEKGGIKARKGKRAGEKGRGGKGGRRGLKCSKKQADELDDARADLLRPHVWMKQLIKALKTKKRFLVKFKMIPRARVPVLKCLLRPTLSSPPASSPPSFLNPKFKLSNGTESILPCDFIFGEGRNVPQSVEFTRDLLSRSPFLFPLSLVLKSFLSQKGMSEVIKGGIGSYCLLVLVQAFLEKYESRCNGDLGLSLLLFFSHYSHTHDYLRDVVVLRKRGERREIGGDVREGAKGRSEVGRIGGGTKQERGWFDASRPCALSVEDPQCPANDIGKSSFKISKIIKAFKQAERVLRTNWAKCTKTPLQDFAHADSFEVLSLLIVTDREKCLDPVGQNFPPPDFLGGVKNSENSTQVGHRGVKRKGKDAILNALGNNLGETFSNSFREGKKSKVKTGESKATAEKRWEMGKEESNEELFSYFKWPLELTSYPSSHGKTSLKYFGQRSEPAESDEMEGYDTFPRSGNVCGPFKNDGLGWAFDPPALDFFGEAGTAGQQNNENFGYFGKSPKLSHAPTKLWESLVEKSKKIFGTEGGRNRGQKSGKSGINLSGTNHSSKRNKTSECRRGWTAGGMESEDEWKEREGLRVVNEKRGGSAFRGRKGVILGGKRRMAMKNKIVKRGKNQREGHSNKLD